jgi:copper(I)-binding protein
MTKNNTFTWLAASALLFFVRTVHAEVQIAEARAVLSATAPRSVELTFVLRNATDHELELMKVVSARAERVDFKVRSYGPDGRPRVWPVAKFEVPAGGLLKLSTDGRFFQVTDLDAKLRAGDPLPIVFTFEDEPPVQLTVTLEAAPR